jgi:hypothetical protein
MRATLSLLTVLWLSCSGTTTSGPVERDGGVVSESDAGLCTGTVDVFRSRAYPTVFSRCAACHVGAGQADGTRFILRAENSPAALPFNIQAVLEAGALEINGQPLLLLKATGAVAHTGGTLFVDSSAEAQVLRETLRELKSPTLCPGDGFPRPQAAGVFDLTHQETLHKMSWQLAGRVPTEAERAAVESQGLAAFDAIVAAQLAEPGFEERLREMLGDWLLTDGFRANNIASNEGNLLSKVYHHQSVKHWGGDDYDWRSWPDGEGILLVEALAREPVEFAVHALKNKRSLAEVVTGRYRLLNAYSARFYGVPYKGFAAGTPFAQIPRPGEFVEVKSVPLINENASGSEYAGVLTTTAWLNRYPSSPTNFNRKRARFTLKYFLNFDIMKAAPRIDASAVNLADRPTVTNSQCTGCHQQLDPLAGLYLNQDECGYDAQVFYSPPKANVCNSDGWQTPTEMFAPGTGAALSQQISRAQRPKALELLGSFIASERTFGKSMVTMVYTSLLGRGILVPPTDPSSANFDALTRAVAFENAELEQLTGIFVAGGLRLEPLVTAIVKSTAFRAGNTDVTQRAELTGLGGGTLVNPELLHRKIESALGIVWAEHGWRNTGRTGFQSLGRHDGTKDAYLLQREQLKTLYGGMDGTFTGTKVRQRGVSSLSAAIVEHMALETSCIATVRDFGRPSAERLLFGQLEKDQVPKDGALPDATFLQTIQALHQRLLGVAVAGDAPEVAELYSLFVDVRAAGLAAMAAGKESATLDRPCSSDVNLETGVTTPGAGITQDPTYVIRAWQAVLATLLLDPRFTLER